MKKEQEKKEKMKTEEKTPQENNMEECTCGEEAPLQENGQEDEVIKLTRENETLKDLLQRRQADFENYKKRSARLQEDYKKIAIKEFARDIININDDLIRAVEAAESLSDNGSAETKKSFSEGVSIISRRIEETLGRYGIVEVEAEGQTFDPNFHEAVEIEEDADLYETDTVTKVHQKGFRLDEHIIRTAKVKVAKAARKNEPAQLNGEEESRLSEEKNTAGEEN